MDDVSDNSLEVSIPLAEIETAKARRPLPVVSVRFEHRSRTLTLSSDHTTHLSLSLLTGAALRGGNTGLRLGFYSETIYIIRGSDIMI